MIIVNLPINIRRNDTVCFNIIYYCLRLIDKNEDLQVILNLQTTKKSTQDLPELPFAQ